MLYAKSSKRYTHNTAFTNMRQGTGITGIDREFVDRLSYTHTQRVGKPAPTQDSARVQDPAGRGKAPLQAQLLSREISKSRKRWKKEGNLKTVIISLTI